jgi:hypothetical protein
LKHYPKLFSAGIRACGSWNQALKAEGIEVPRAPYFGRLPVLRAFREFLDGHSKKALPQALKLAAVYYLGSVEKAIAQSQTDPTILAGWTTATILDLVSQRHKNKQSLVYSVVR